MNNVPHFVGDKASRARSLMVNDLRLETKESRVRVRLPAMCRGELSAIITRLISMSVKRVEVVERS